ncbi:MAG: DUF1353 domain-containing protein [Cyanobacteria bacterium J06623_7]
MRLISNGNPIKTKDGKYRLVEDWQLEHDRIVPILIVPKGYKTDLASIPKWAKPLFGLWTLLSQRRITKGDGWKRGLYDKAAVAHDYIWDYGCLQTSYGKEFPFTREESDRLFYEICLAVGVYPKTAFLMYVAVRIYSIYSYYKNKLLTSYITK